MEQRISLVTLGVGDLVRSRTFYNALGWSGQEVEETVFFRAGGQAFVLWDRRKLADDAGIDDSPAGGFSGIALAHNVRSSAEVDEIIAVAREAGAVVTRQPAATSYGGYAAYFVDPDGHVWEVAHNPGFQLDDDGNLIVPDFDRVEEAT